MYVIFIFITNFANACLISFIHIFNISIFQYFLTIITIIIMLIVLMTNCFVNVFVCFMHLTIYLYLYVYHLHICIWYFNVFFNIFCSCKLLARYIHLYNLQFLR